MAGEERKGAQTPKAGEKLTINQSGHITANIQIGGERVTLNFNSRNELEARIAKLSSPLSVDSPPAAPAEATRSVPEAFEIPEEVIQDLYDRACDRAGEELNAEEFRSQLVGKYKTITGTIGDIQEGKSDSHPHMFKTNINNDKDGAKLVEPHHFFPRLTHSQREITDFVTTEAAIGLLFPNEEEGGKVEVQSRPYHVGPDVNMSRALTDAKIDLRNVHGKGPASLETSIYHIPKIPGVFMGIQTRRLDSDTRERTYSFISEDALQHLLGEETTEEKEALKIQGLPQAIEGFDDAILERPQEVRGRLIQGSLVVHSSSAPTTKFSPVEPERTTPIPGTSMESALVTEEINEPSGNINVIFKVEKNNNKPTLITKTLVGNDVTQEQALSIKRQAIEHNCVQIANFRAQGGDESTLPETDLVDSEAIERLRTHLKTPVVIQLPSENAQPKGKQFVVREDKSVDLLDKNGQFLRTLTAEERKKLADYVIAPPTQATPPPPAPESRARTQEATGSRTTAHVSLNPDGTISIKGLYDGKIPLPDIKDLGSYDTHPDQLLKTFEDLKQKVESREASDDILPYSMDVMESLISQLKKVIENPSEAPKTQATPESAKEAPQAEEEIPPELAAKFREIDSNDLPDHVKESQKEMARSSYDFRQRIKEMNINSIVNIAKDLRQQGIAPDNLILETAQQLSQMYGETVEYYVQLLRKEMDKK